MKWNKATRHRTSDGFVLSAEFFHVMLGGKSGYCGSVEGHGLKLEGPRRAAKEQAVRDAEQLLGFARLIRKEIEQ